MFTYSFQHFKPIQKISCHLSNQFLFLFLTCLAALVVNRVVGLQTASLFARLLLDLVAAKGKGRVRAEAVMAASRSLVDLVWAVTMSWA